MSKKCTDCKYCVTQDQGYSNYTIEGRETDCLLGEHPSFPVDRWYGENKSFAFAEECKRFERGEEVEIDVEREDGEISNYSDDEEIKELLIKWDEK